MSRIWKIVITISIIIAAIIGVVIITHNQNTPTSEPTSSKTKTEETELIPEIKKEYTGYCAIYGKYRQRYVECVGDYDPEAKIKAEAKAKECNESDKAVHGCTDRYQ